MKRVFLISVLAIWGSACSTAKQEPIVNSEWVTPVELQEVEVQENSIPGTVTEPWEEANYDVIEVPAQLDPTGTYYRPAYRTIVEIFPGRTQVQQFPLESDSNGN